jgi:hypothetical protein
MTLIAVDVEVFALCPDRTRAIPCKVRAVTEQASVIWNIRGLVTATQGMSDRVHSGLGRQSARCASLNAAAMARDGSHQEVGKVQETADQSPVL